MINDFSAYGNLSGCSMKGYKACPICGDHTSSIRLKYGKKMVYLGHRNFLPHNHPFCRQKKSFNGQRELGSILEPLSGEAQFSIFQKKTKDGLNARRDLADLKIRPELTPINGDKKNFIPPTCYTLTKKEKRFLLKTLSEMKVPRGYSSNVRNLVSIEDSKLNGLKSHDCHVLLQQLLPVSIRYVLPKHVQYAITSLCLFFNSICNKVIDVTQ
ncbi:hypothetical protein IC582_030477 [Cucumis melo]